MKLVVKPIDVIAVFCSGGIPRPYKFRCTEQGWNNTEMKVDKIIYCEKQNKAGLHSYLYECQSTADGVVFRYQLRYTLDDARWVLYKI